MFNMKSAPGRLSAAIRNNASHPRTATEGKSDVARLVRTITAGPAAIISVAHDNFKQAGIVGDGNQARKTSPIRHPEWGWSFSARQQSEQTRPGMLLHTLLTPLAGRSFAVGWLSATVDFP
jgi:hypothetical protein